MDIIRKNICHDVSKNINLVLYSPFIQTFSNFTLFDFEKICAFFHEHAKMRRVTCLGIIVQNINVSGQLS
jgi:hypothetical protein